MLLVSRLLHSARWPRDGAAGGVRPVTALLNAESILLRTNNPHWRGAHNCYAVTCQRGRSTRPKGIDAREIDLHSRTRTTKIPTRWAVCIGHMPNDPRAQRTRHT